MKVPWVGIIFIIAGILVLVFPLIINWVIGIALIIAGILYLIKR
jgi:uncharacterized membrane protein HdeD (DUF308 family)